MDKDHSNLLLFNSDKCLVSRVLAKLTQLDIQILRSICNQHSSCFELLSDSNIQLDKMLLKFQFKILNHKGILVGKVYNDQEKKLLY